MYTLQESDKSTFLCQVREPIGGVNDMGAGSIAARDAIREVARSHRLAEKQRGQYRPQPSPAQMSRWQIAEEQRFYARLTRIRYAFRDINTRFLDELRPFESLVATSELTVLQEHVQRVTDESERLRRIPPADQHGLDRLALEVRNAAITAGKLYIQYVLGSDPSRRIYRSRKGDVIMDGVVLYHLGPA
jgi:hypothetical protein